MSEKSHSSSPWLRRIAGWLWSDGDESEPEQERDVRLTRNALVGAIAIGLSILGLYALQAPWPRPLELLGVGAMVSAAALAAGALVGFLFGIPRTLTDQGGEPAHADTADSTAARRRDYAVNTNLEQISDWLTKILVGVTLTELRRLPALLSQASERVSTALNIPVASAAYSAAILVYFLVCGFFSGYLLTRLFLAGAFSRADRELVAVQEKLEQLVNDPFPVSDLADTERSWLLRVLGSSEPVTLTEDFERHSPEHEALRVLRTKLLVRPVDGGKWIAGKRVELTPLAKAGRAGLKASLGDT